MSLSLPLRINLISLVFASLVASVLTALGGVFLHHQQTDNALVHAQRAADELLLRTRKLLDLQLKLEDFMGFDAQCAAVVKNDPLLRAATVFDTRQQRRFQSPGAPMNWPHEASTGDQAPTDGPLHSSQGQLILRSVVDGEGRAQAYVVVQVDDAAVLHSTLQRVAWLVASALLLFLVGLVIQQAVFWRAVGRPLEGLVRMADNIQPDNLAPLPAPEHPDDDIGRLYGAFSRLMQRLLEARNQLLAHNEQLEATVQQRTRELERLNGELAGDIERRKQLEEELHTRASTDELTGLANRAFILPHAERRLAQARRDQRPFGLMLFDLNGFKAVNDTHGHAAGDAVLRAVAQRVRAVCRGADTVARLGGDEFLLAFEGARDEASATALAQRLLASFDAPVQVDGLTLRVGCSIGLAMHPGHGDDVDVLLASADAAMYQAKRSGGGICLGTVAPKKTAPPLPQDAAACV